MPDADGKQTGELFGSYRIVTKLGQGGMGVVYRAVDERSGLDVALKLLRTEHVEDPERRRRFVREARIVAALDHPGVAHVHEVGEVDGEVFLAMDLAPGESLRVVLDAARETGVHLPVNEAVAIARTIAEAVAYAHAKGIVHRDLKPENVSVASGGDVRVLDFGLAKLRETTGALLYEAETETSVTREGRVIGTTAYMAPEQAAGKEVSFRGDVFSLGVILFEMLTSARPFVGASTMDVIIAITRDAPPIPSSLSPLVSAELDALVLRCLAKKAEDRPTMEELGAELAKPNLVREPRVTRPVRAGAWKAVALAGTISIVSAALIAWWHARATPPPSPVLPEAPAATAVTDLPLPSSSVPAALAEYQEAVRNEREGAEDAALIKLEHATELDPELAAAHLRLAFRLAFLEANNARAHFSQAVKFRDRLSPRDIELLEASRPLFQHDPPDLDEWSRRLLVVSEHYPNDADVWFDVGTMRGVLGEFAEDEKAEKRAIAIDPRFGLAMNERAQAQAYTGDFAGSRATVEQCLAVSPSASWCMWVREFIDDHEGACAANESSARQRIAIDPTIPDGYKALVFSLGALDRPLPVVQEAIDQALQRIKDPASREHLRLSLGHRVEELYGDFESAASDAAKLRDLVAKRSDIAQHSNAALASALVEREIGHEERAGKIANEFLERKEIWSADPVPHDYSLATDLTPELLSIAYHAHAISESAYQTGITSWRTSWNARLRGGYRAYLWVYGYAEIAETKSEAEEAVAALPKYAPIPPWIPNGMLPEAAVGRTLWLAGREDEGIARLRLATRDCSHVTSPIAWIHAHAWLGDALARRGEVDEACKDYGVVLAHWGKAKPRSITADHARERRAALNCAALK